jgi:hypothetical protein
MKQKRGIFVGLVVLLMAAGFLCTTGALAADMFPCAPEDKMEKDIGAGAELAEFSCYFDRWAGENVLHMKVGVKNSSDADQRFRVNILLDNGKAVGGLIPRKTKKGLVKPGETASFVYPVKSMTEKPGSVMLKISTVGQ